MSPAPKAAEITANPTAGERESASDETARSGAETVPLQHEEVARLAYSYWEARGRPCGTPEQDWFRAEQDLLMERVVWGRQPAGSAASRSSQRAARKSAAS